MTSTSAAWLLDVDGVIRAPYPRWVDPIVVTDIQGIRTKFAPELAARLRDLAAIVDITWATSWCAHPDELRELGTYLGLELPLAFVGRLPSQTWADPKVAAVRAALTAGRQVIWTDDAEVPAALRLFADLREAQASGRLLAIAPDTFRGLRPEHLDAIERFAFAALRAPQAA